MEILTKVLTVSEIIRIVGLTSETVLQMDFEYIDGVDIHFITLNSKRFLAFSSSSLRLKTFRKIKAQGLGLGWVAPQLTDEEEGIIQASKNGENPFAYSIMCSNPQLNEVVI